MTNTTAVAPVLLWSPLTAKGYDELADHEACSRENAAQVLAAEVGTEVVCFGTPSMLVASRVWSDVCGPGVSPSQVVLSSDGFNVDVDWCHCLTVIEDDWQYYERWSARGRVGHGWACSDCRGILQVG